MTRLHNTTQHTHGIAFLNFKGRSGGAFASFVVATLVAVVAATLVAFIVVAFEAVEVFALPLWMEAPPPRRCVWRCVLLAYSTKVEFDAASHGKIRLKPTTRQKGCSEGRGFSHERCEQMISRGRLLMFFIQGLARS